MKIKSLFLLVALVLPMAPALVHAQGAPAMPLVVCHVDQAPQMLVPAYLCQWYCQGRQPLLTETSHEQDRTDAGAGRGAQPRL